MSSRVLGVDACKAGWVGVVVHDGAATVHAARTVAALVAEVEIGGGLAAIGIDIPIGLPDTERRVVEVHPEVSFAELAGSPLLAGKRTWAGARHRRRLLAAAGIHLADDVGDAGRHAAVDDVLDAGAAAWTATRVATGAATPLPNPPVEYSDGWPAAIWV